MRDIRFIAQHRGGTLTNENHRGLIRWARLCVERVLPLLQGNVDARLLHALQIAEAWEKEQAATGEAMKASVAAHAAAREYSDPVSVAVARAVGQAVATAHMADHSMGGSLYARKALSLAGKSIKEEREWQVSQLQQLPPDIVELVLEAMTAKEKSFKIE